MIGAILVLALAIYIAVAPVKYLLPPYMHLDEQDKPAMYMSNTEAYHGIIPSAFNGTPVSIEIGPLGFIAIIKPSEKIPSDVDGTESMINWYLENIQWVNDMTHEYGGLLLRGFNMKTPQDFDHFIESVHPDIEASVYLGTTPRFRINGTKYIQSASEAPWIISIPTHIELSFTPNPPKRIYFYADQLNEAPGGHTPFTDFRAVWEQMDPDLKDKILKRGWLYERWYTNKGDRNYDPLKSKPWQDMFLTDNKTIAFEMAAKQEFNASWDASNNVLLRHYAVITRNNEATGRDFWCTHFNVLHAPTFSIPYAWDAQLLNSKFSVLAAWLLEIWVQGRRLLGYRYGHNTYWADDESEIEWDDAMNVRKLISRNTWSFPYERGDLVVLDNHRTAHGRTPWYKGKRSVLVAYK